MARLILRKPGTTFRQPLEGFEGVEVVCVQPDENTARTILEELKGDDSPTSDFDFARRVYGLVFQSIEGTGESGQESISIVTNGKNGELESDCLAQIFPIAKPLFRLLLDMIVLRPEERKNSQPPQSDNTESSTTGKGSSVPSAAEHAL